MIDRQVSLLGAPDVAIGQPQVKGKGLQAMQLDLTADVIEELLDCIKSGKTPQILLGNSPMLRYRGKFLSLETHPEKFQHEIYRSDTSDNEDAWEFAGLVGQKLSVRKHEEPTAADDRALEVFQSRMADIKREREAQTAILATPDLLPTKLKSHYVKNSSLLKPPTNSKNTSISSSPALGPVQTSTPTSAPQQASDEDMSLKRALKQAVITVLALERCSSSEISRRIRCPLNQLLRDTISSIAVKEGDGKDAVWKLSDRSYLQFSRIAELDPFVLKISVEDRDTIIKRAAKAFGRLRLDQQNPAWKKLLPVEDRKNVEWWKAFSQYHLNTDNIKASTPAMKPVSFSSKTGLPKRNEVKKSDKPKSFQAEKANGTPKLAPSSKPVSKKAEKEQKPSASTKTQASSKPKNPSPLSRSSPLNATDLEKDHPVQKKPAASPPSAKRKADGTPNDHTPPKRSRQDPSSAEKSAASSAGPPKRKGADPDSDRSAASTPLKKAKAPSGVGAPAVNGARANGIHAAPRAASGGGGIETPSASASEDSGSPVELTWHQKVKLAQNFKRYYGRYKARHEELSARARKGEAVGEAEEGELWTMHRRLQSMKAKIYGAEG